MAYHAFVAMPFGVKDKIDFNKIYGELIKPALESAGFTVFRADEEMRAGNIRTDMFQELLLADLVIADLSIDNPNVWYEVGVRHALRRRGAIHITCRRDREPFDLLTERSLKYQVKENPDGNAAPDPVFIEADKKMLAQAATATINAWYDRKDSPVYHLVRFLTEPDWKSLRVEEAREFWEEYESYTMRIEVARKRQRPGDILVFAEEAPTRVFRVEAFQTAGKALLSLGQYKFALAQYENALAIKPKDLESRRQKGLLLGRLKRHDEAKEWIDSLIKDHPNDAESWALLGRTEKEGWSALWRRKGASAEQMCKDAADEEGLLREAINAYATGYRKDSTHYYSGINAVTLLHLQMHLTSNEERQDVRNEMETCIRWSLRGALERENETNEKDYWARVTMAELEALVGSKRNVQEAYRNAVAVADKDWFKLASSREQLTLLQDLGFRSEEVTCGMETVDRALSRITAPEKTWAPGQVFLFSGHMIDAPDRPEPRFPADKEPIAAKAIADLLDELKAGPDDIAVCGGACGGDLLFAEACLARGARVELRLAYDEPTFLQKSVSFAPGKWTDRFYQVKRNPKTALLLMPDELGPVPQGVNAFARTNLWQLYTTLAWGPDKVHFICLWNRKGGDGPGGTEHMYETVQRYFGHVHVLDTTKLW